LVWFVLKRLWHYPGLTSMALLGVILSVGLITSASFFAQAVDRVMLGEELGRVREVTGRPPFASQVYTFPSTRRPLSLADAELLSQDIARVLATEINLPLQHVGIQVDSGSLMLQPVAGSSLYGEGQRYLGSISLIYIESVERHIEVIEGDALDAAPSAEALDVWMHASMAEAMGVNVGEQLRAGVTMVQPDFLLRLRGIWQARYPTDSFWFSDPDFTLGDSFLVRREDYIRYVEPTISSKSRLAYWHIILDETGIVPADGQSYIAGFQRSLNIINKFLPETQLNAPSLASLRNFVTREETLTLLLLGFNVPALGILLYFLILTSTIIAHWQRREVAVLVSRGMSASGVIWVTLLEEMLLFVIGLPLGIGLGLVLARLMGYTATFLSFTYREPLPVSLQGINLPLVWLALAVALLARLWPTVQASRHSAVSQEREQARPQHGPFWYRYYLDLLLILPTYYAYRQLADRGSLALLIRDQPEDVLRDPLLILGPALFILTTALIFMRFFAVMMRLVDRLAGFTSWLTLHLALRQLGRQSQSYINPLLIVIISLGLGVYLLSMAASLDQWLVDRIYYQVGADLSFEPFQERFNETPMTDGEWIPPRELFLQLPGVTEATNVGDYRAEINLAAGQTVRGRFLALDRLTFPSVAWFRYDFTPESLGGLMNRLAASPDSILIPQQFLSQRNLQIGDKVTLEVVINPDLETSASFTIAGSYTYFPTVYEDEVAVIGNLDYFTFLFGVTAPHRVWLRTQEQVVDGETIFESMPQLGIEAIRRYDSKALINQEKARLERVGIFGSLSIGFLASITLAGLGLLINSYGSLQERLYRFAVLHAVGVGRQQIVGQVALEYCCLLAYGAAAGAGVGIVASELFVPFFRITDADQIPLPPLLPLIARDAVWSLTVSFTAVIVLAEIALISRVLYRRLAVMLKAHWG
jgi:putative ABC transport system permease protein